MQTNVERVFVHGVVTLCIVGRFLMTLLLNYGRPNREPIKQTNQN